LGFYLFLSTRPLLIGGGGFSPTPLLVPFCSVSGDTEGRSIHPRHGRGCGAPPRKRRVRRWGPAPASFQALALPSFPAPALASAPQRVPAWTPIASRARPRLRSQSPLASSRRDRAAPPPRFLASATSAATLARPSPNLPSAQAMSLSPAMRSVCFTVAGGASVVGCNGHLLHVGRAAGMSTPCPCTCPCPRPGPRPTCRLPLAIAASLAPVTPPPQPRRRPLERGAGCVHVPSAVPRGPEKGPRVGGGPEAEGWPEAKGPRARRVRAGGDGAPGALEMTRPGSRPEARPEA